MVFTLSVELYGTTMVDLSGTRHAPEHLPRALHAFIGEPTGIFHQDTILTSPNYSEFKIKINYLNILQVLRYGHSSQQNRS